MPTVADTLSHVQLALTCEAFSAWLNLIENCSLREMDNELIDVHRV